MAIELINWLEIPVKDMQRARQFYESLFGFKITDLEIAGEIYPCFPNRDNEGYSGALVQYDFTAPGRQGPLVYLNAEPDIASMLSKVMASGGKILKERQEIAPGFGFFAIFEDTEGNMLALQGMH